MQTFMPYSDFEKSASCLDHKRLGKQRVEAWQIYLSLTQKDYGWKNHPIVKMWKGHEKALLWYGMAICREWKGRGFKDTMFERFFEEFKKFSALGAIHESEFPEWVNDKELNISHQSNLIRKDAKIYAKKFPGIKNDIPYKWVVQNGN